MMQTNGNGKRSFRRRWADYQLPIMVLLAAAALFLGFTGFVRHASDTGETRTFLDNLYLTLGLLSLNTGAVEGPVNWQLEVARFLVPAIAAYTAILAFAMVFTQQAQLVRLWIYRDHIVICGLGMTGYRLAHQFRAQGKKVVVIESDEGNDWIDSVRAAGIIVINGDGRDPEMLQKVRLNRAKYLIAVAGSDGINAEVAVQAEQISARRANSSLTCIVHIVDPELWYLLREKELYVSPEAHFRLELFNIFDRGASVMLKLYSSLKSAQNGDDLLIIGLGKLGQSLVVQAALKWQQTRPDGKARLPIWIIDLEAEEKVGQLCERYPHLDEISDLRPLKMNVQSADFHRAEFLFNGETSRHISGIFICMDDDALVLHTGLVLYQKVRDLEIPVVVRMVEDAGLALLLHDGSASANVYRNLIGFPLLDKTCTPELVLKGTHEIIARELHDTYLDSIRGEPTLPAQPEWDELPETTKEWNRKQADRVSLILEEHGYRIAPLVDWKKSNLKFAETTGQDEVAAMACMEHEMWCREMHNDGWRFGAGRSREEKTNPALVPWEELPAEEIVKNKNFIRSLPKVLARAGFQIEKKNAVRLAQREATHETREI